MNNTDTKINSNQKIFQDILLGTLIYSVVLGFFNDYTDILNTTSYSTTFLASFVLQLMIYPTFKLKSFLVSWWNQRDTKHKKIGMVLSVWAVMFFSKFVFLEVIDIVFGSNVEMSGFIGLIAIIACATILQKLISIINQKL